ncbi:MAG: 3'-5' exonuclease [Treponema sp.]|jgi:DNA polymerase-3 subunit epsilon|nr:3'-5' exonuclease [Treponema sp.]
MNFVTIDFETAKYSRESACSVGLVRFENGIAGGTYYSLIRPPVLYIRPDFTRIHGLTVDDVKDAPVFSAIWESQILPFIGDMPLAAHNASFDMGILRAVLQWYGLKIPRLRFFDTLFLARRTWPELESHALTRLGETFGINYNAHNALDDAHTCGKIVLLAAEKRDAKNIKTLLKSSGIRMEKL